MDNQKLYVGNLSFDTNDAELRNHFSDVGEVVSARVITDRHTQTSRGFGFVEMATPTLATQACAKLDGSTLAGRNLRVNPAEDKPRARGEYNR